MIHDHAAQGLGMSKHQIQCNQGIEKILQAQNQDHDYSQNYLNIRGRITFTPARNFSVSKRH